MESREIAALLSSLDRAFERKAWHGPNLLGSLRGVTPREASFRPAPGRHSIAELIVHCAYWKYAVKRRVTKERRGSFPLAGSDWFARGGPDAGALAADLALLKRCHRELREVVAELPPERLDERARPGGWTLRETIAGAADHDIYHAGQVSLLKRLAKARSARRSG